MTEHVPEKLIDLTFLKEFCKDDREKIIKYIHLFLESAPEQLEMMKSMARAGDWLAVKTAAHSLKPQLVFVGALSVSPLIERIEATSVSENALAETPQIIASLERLLDQTFHELIQSLVSLA